MSSGAATAAAAVTTSSSCSQTSSRHRRFGDFIDGSANLSDEESDTYGFIQGPHYHLHQYLTQHSHKNLLPRKHLLWLPESLFGKIEDGLLWVQSLRSGRNAGRSIIGVLALMLIFSLFVTMSFLGSRVRVVEPSAKSAENGLLVMQAFRDDSSVAQRIVAEDEVSSMPKRVLEKFSVS